MFLLLDPELSTTVISALRGSDSTMQESIPLRYASILISKGFFYPSHEIGIIVKTHLRVVSIIYHLKPCFFLWVYSYTFSPIFSDKRDRSSDYIRTTFRRTSLGFMGALSHFQVWWLKPLAWYWTSHTNLLLFMFCIMICRSDGGRQALLAIVHFPEVSQLWKL